MTEPLTIDRFRALADAYGGAVARWPAQYQNAALRLMARPDAAAILEEASALDDRLDRWFVPLPSYAVSAAVTARGPLRLPELMSRARLWWSGFGVAATLAGAVAGSTAVAMVAPMEAPTSGSTSFGDVAGSD